MAILRQAPMATSHMTRSADLERTSLARIEGVTSNKGNHVTAPLVDDEDAAPDVGGFAIIAPVRRDDA